ncbi:hypothetical protein OQA88_6896 [Cercophora sp. LCS_1]
MPFPSFLSARAVSRAAVALGCLAAETIALPERVIHSRNSNSQVTFRETKFCETTIGVNAFSGYIKVPSLSTIDGTPYDANIFFWFFEARDVNPYRAPLTVWLNGGPGSGSTTHAVGGHNGPCIVRSDSNSTVLNQWSWNKVSNMLYIDQPAQTGFSVDGNAVDGFRNMLTAEILPGGSGSGNLTNRKGKFSGQNPGNTVTTTAAAARAIGDFLDCWFDEFWGYRRGGIHIWSQSYGGHWAPAIAAELMPERYCRGRHGWCGDNSRFHIEVDSIGIINGVIDMGIQIGYYPHFAVNNTYGIETIPPAAAAFALDSLTQPGGCAEQAALCRSLQEQYDPNNTGTNATINGVCLGAFGFCWANVYGVYEGLSGRNPLDIAHTLLDPFPPQYAQGFLNNKWVQDALGAKVNYTEISPVVNNAFIFSGDFVRGYTTQISDLLDSGVRVALVYGDRDYRANWFGGEAVSLAITHDHRTQFASAGYANLATSSSYTGGKVRQHNLLSFSRVYQAGHEVPYYQPETAFKIFSRTINGYDVATGSVRVNRQYKTTGPSSVANVNSGPPTPAQGPGVCYVDAAPLGERCNAAQLGALVDGSAVVVQRVVATPGP